VGVNYCEGEHTPGEPFESGNVYCKKCGEFMYCFLDILKVYEEVTHGAAYPEAVLTESGWVFGTPEKGYRTAAEVDEFIDDGEDEI
jgi:hypothetical protein